MAKGSKKSTATNQTAKSAEAADSNPRAARGRGRKSAPKASDAEGNHLHIILPTSVNEDHVSYQVAPHAAAKHVYSTRNCECFPLLTQLSYRDYILITTIALCLAKKAQPQAVGQLVLGYYRSTVCMYYRSTDF